MQFRITITGTHGEAVETRQGVVREVDTLVQQLRTRGYHVTDVGFEYDVQEAEAPEIPENLNDLTVTELRALLTNQGIDPDEDVEGTGSGGNVVKTDLVKALENARQG